MDTSGSMVQRIGFELLIPKMVLHGKRHQSSLDGIDMARRRRDYRSLTIVEAIRRMVDIKRSPEQRNMNMVEEYFLLRAADIIEECDKDEPLV